MEVLLKMAKRYRCSTCGDSFNDEAMREEHQFAYYHGKYKHEGEGEDMPRNVMGGM